MGGGGEHQGFSEVQTKILNLENIQEKKKDINKLKWSSNWIKIESF